MSETPPETVTVRTKTGCWTVSSFTRFHYNVSYQRTGCWGQKLLREFCRVKRAWWDKSSRLVVRQAFSAALIANRHVWCVTWVQYLLLPSVSHMNQDWYLKDRSIMKSIKVVGAPTRRFGLEEDMLTTPGLDRSRAPSRNLEIRKKLAELPELSCSRRFNHPNDLFSSATFRRNMMKLRISNESHIVSVVNTAACRGQCCCSCLLQRDFSAS